MIATLDSAGMRHVTTATPAPSILAMQALDMPIQQSAVTTTTATPSIRFVQCNRFMCDVQIRRSTVMIRILVQSSPAIEALDAPDQQSALTTRTPAPSTRAIQALGVAIRQLALPIVMLETPICALQVLDGAIIVSAVMTTTPAQSIPGMQAADVPIQQAAVTIAMLAPTICPLRRKVVCSLLQLVTITPPARPLRAMYRFSARMSTKYSPTALVLFTVETTLVAVLQFIGHC
ncbi:unnamed protein product [Didymodactylos carnosus]|uniref:Uncharacterized protein n=1 Tax=Didymodactylos carnosus TaxID=1234261 RepID=A0A814PM37_9BILA|nr:unnamed protein product [Didymodactylos carnosus]CAF1268249.1 unnamed protein product [Didymodactylos carnosus]CAF3872477.1 unnamed protein product [Didymodactylos carnosus]CAF4074018.1 unnamed protein product [Didymodactylos carnosus]